MLAEARRLGDYRVSRPPIAHRARPADGDAGRRLARSSASTSTGSSDAWACGVNFASKGPPARAALHRARRARRPRPTRVGSGSHASSVPSLSTRTMRSGSMRSRADEVGRVVDREVRPVVAVRQDVAPVVGVAADPRVHRRPRARRARRGAPSCQKRPAASSRMVLSRERPSGAGKRKNSGWSPGFTALGAWVVGARRGSVPSGEARLDGPGRGLEAHRSNIF